MLKSNNFKVIKADEQGLVDILKLRAEVYISEEKRIGSVDDFAESFDRYSSYSTYFIAFCRDKAIGTIKVIQDSPIGLPCDEVTNIDNWKNKGKVVELGHMIVLPEFRRSNVVLYLMREALKYTIKKINANYILADIFLDKKNHLKGFYHQVGFIEIFGPYKDSRFANSPESSLILLEIYKLYNIYREAKGEKRKLLEFILN
jgi:putrescine aminotransferase